MIAAEAKDTGNGFYNPGACSQFYLQEMLYRKMSDLLNDDPSKCLAKENDNVSIALYLHMIEHNQLLIHVDPIQFIQNQYKIASSNEELN
jgi:hypothetical protein